MRLTLPYTYTKDVVPPRCRKPRPRECTGTVTLAIREVSVAEAPVAIVHHTQSYDPTRKSKKPTWRKFDVTYRWYQGQLYTRALLQRNCQKPSLPQTAEEFTMDPRDVQHALAGKAKGFGMGRWVYFTPTAEQLTFLTTCHPKD